MRKNIRSALAVLVAIGWLGPARALALQISEVMYDPDGADAGREWVEIWNDGPDSADLSSVFLLEADVRHKIAAAVPGVPPVLGAGERAIVADRPELFAADYPDVSPVFDSAFSLSNSGERIALVTSDGDEYSSVEWGTGSGAAGGKSWQRAGATWLAAAATPGSANADREEAPAASASPSAAPAVSAHSGTGGVTTVRRERGLLVDAGRSRVVPVGVELEIEPEVEGATRASFWWSWGDGDSSRGRRGRHVYRHPGTYVVVLNVRGAGGVVATSRTSVLVAPIDLDVSVERRGEGVAVVVRSSSPHEINLGGFALEGSGKPYVLPQDTILLPLGEIAVDAEESGLGASPGESIELRRPDGKPVRRAAAA
jgi:hypothetical protein